MNLEMMRIWADMNKQQYEHEQLKKALSNQKEHEERLLRMVEDGLITRDEWREMMGMKILKGNAEINQLERKLKNMKGEENLEIPKALNCPNCGAPITGDKCEYCGTVFNKQLAKINDNDLIHEFGCSQYKMSLGEFQKALKYLVAKRRENS